MNVINWDNLDTGAQRHYEYSYYYYYEQTKGVNSFRQTSQA